MGRLAEKVAIITGASSGIGRAIAIAFGHEGARIVCSDIRADARPEGYEDDAQKKATAAVVLANGGQACFVQADVTQVRAVHEPPLQGVHF